MKQQVTQMESSIMQIFPSCLPSCNYYYVPGTGFNVLFSHVRIGMCALGCLYGETCLKYSSPKCGAHLNMEASLEN